MKKINPCEITASITAAANMIAKDLSDNELNLLSAIFTQLSDTLQTIAAIREINENRSCKNDEQEAGEKDKSSENASSENTETAENE